MGEVLKHILAATLSIAIFPASAGNTLQIPVGSAGSLQLDVENEWQETRVPSDSRATLSFESKVADRFTLLLTPSPQQGSEAEVRDLVQRTAARTGPRSVEKTLTLQVLRGKQASGYYFRATDPAPKPGEFRFMYQGAVSVGASLVAFTVLFNDGAEKDAETALSAIRGLRFIGKSDKRSSKPTTWFTAWMHSPSRASTSTPLSALPSLKISA